MGSKVIIGCYWQDYDHIAVSDITCDCGRRYEYGQGRMEFNSGDEWTCGKCRKTIKFLYVGMTWQEKKVEKE